MGFFSPNLKILNDWRSSLTTAFSQLRRVPFVVEDTFQFTNFDPSPTTTMNTSNLSITTAVGLKLNKLFFFSVEFTMTLAAPLSDTINFIIPYTAAIAPGSTIGRTQVGGCETSTAGVPNQVGLWHIDQNSNKIITVRYAGAYGAGTGTVRVNGFVEVK